MKKIFYIFTVITVFIALVIILNKCEFDFNIQNDNPIIDTKSEPAIPENAPVVCIDAGHGFGDPGCQSSYLSEWESRITLITAKLLKERLESKKIRVVLTHDGKTFPTCKEIIKTANKYGISYDSSRLLENNVFSAYERAIYACGLNKKRDIDLFISLHINSIENHPELSQYEIYYCEENQYSESIETLCSRFASRLDNYTKIDATSADQAYTVTRYADYPALLFEMGYATNEADAEKINSTKWRKELCDMLAEEIYNWINDK